jgi:hypothetical protein
VTGAGFSVLAIVSAHNEDIIEATIGHLTENATVPWFAAIESA